MNRVELLRTFPAAADDNRTSPQPEYRELRAIQTVMATSTPTSRITLNSIGQCHSKMANITTRLGYGERTEGPAKEHLAAARPISDSEYDLTVKAGFVQTLVESEFQRPRRSANDDGLEEEAEEFERPIVEMVVAHISPSAKQHSLCRSRRRTKIRVR